MKPDYGIKVGEYYHHKSSNGTWLAKVIEILKPHAGLNSHGYKIAKCEWIPSKDSAFGLIKYF